MLPREFPLVVLDDGREQYRIVERLLRDAATSSVVAATDAGREGELIFRYIYEHARCTKPWQRLWNDQLVLNPQLQAQTGPTAFAAGRPWVAGPGGGAAARRGAITEHEDCGAAHRLRRRVRLTAN